jgi:hypothetical protein
VRGYHPGVIPLLLVIAGGVALAAGWLALRSLGPGVRIGRILAATRIVPVARARQLAEAGARRYVGVQGRVDSEAEFEDEHHRPLVYRRTRLEAVAGRRRTAVDDRREAVPFEVAEGMDWIAVDGDALGEGLVVVSREAGGTAGEIPDRAPEGMDPATPLRLRIEQVSSVEHAIVLGVPELDPERGPILRPGFGRPLVLTTLERPEAMRLLAGGRVATTRLAAALLGGGAALVALGALWGIVDVLALVPAAVLAASPSPTGAAAGDPRSSGQGPGLVGDPLFAIGAVVLIALVAVGATLAYVRATGGSREPARRR